MEKISKKPKLLIICPKENPAIFLLNQYTKISDYVELSQVNSLEQINAMPNPTDYAACFIIYLGMPYEGHSPAELLEAFIEKSPQLKWVHINSAGVDYLITPKLIEHCKKIPFTNSRGAYSQILAEFVLLSILYFAKKIPTLIKQQQEHVFQKVFVKNAFKSKVCIIGYGSIGRAAAKMLKGGLNAEIYAITNSGKAPGDDIATSVGKIEDLDKILPICDYVVNLLPWTQQTDKFFNRAMFEKMNPKAVFINMGRGKSVVESDLINVLQEGKLAGAALDVFEEEPLPKFSRLYDLPNVLISPHTMALSEEGWRLCLERFNDELMNFVNNKPFENMVDLGKGY